MGGQRRGTPRGREKWYKESFWADCCTRGVGGLRGVEATLKPGCESTAGTGLLTPGEAALTPPALPAVSDCASLSGRNSGTARSWFSSQKRTRRAKLVEEKQLAGSSRLCRSCCRGKIDYKPPERSRSQRLCHRVMTAVTRPQGHRAGPPGRAHSGRKCTSGANPKGRSPGVRPGHVRPQGQPTSRWAGGRRGGELATAVQPRGSRPARGLAVVILTPGTLVPPPVYSGLLGTSRPTLSS